MNLRFFSKFKTKKNFIFALGFLLLLWFARLGPVLKPLILEIFKNPLILVRFIGREIGGMIFYHRNLVLAERSSAEIGLLQKRLNEFDEARLENERLRNLLHLKRETAYQVIAARIIGRSPDKWSSLVMIDKGRHQGVQSGMAVIHFAGLVGRVIEASLTTSKIMLANDPGFSVSSIIQRSRQECLISGALGNSLIMRYLPKDADIQIEDTVVTSGFTDTYPKGIVVGRVDEIGQEFSGLTRYAIVKPAVELFNIEEVLVIAR